MYNDYSFSRGYVFAGRTKGRNAKIYKIYISHFWEYYPDYILLQEILYTDTSFRWEKRGEIFIAPQINRSTYSVTKQLMMRLNNDIKDTDCLIVISDMYREHPFWINAQMDIATSLFKPIIAMKSRCLLPVPEEIKKNTNIIADWNARSITNAIKNFMLYA